MTGKVKVDGESYRLRGVELRLATADQSTVRLRLGDRAEAKVWKAIRKHRRTDDQPVTAVVRVAFRDVAGNTVTERVEIALT